MGQPSSPLINKLGTNLYWNTMWNDKINYTKKLKEDIFINMFFFLIFKKISIHSNLLKMNYFQKLLKNSSKFHEISSKFYFYKFLKNKTSFFKKNKASYMGKLWILRFNTWLILSTYYYVPQLMLKSKIFQKKNLDLNNKKFHQEFKRTKLIKLYTWFFFKNKTYNFF